MRNKATKKNMDLDLRRYGKMLYTKAEESGGSGSSGGGGGGDSVDINTILDNISIKDDLLTKLQAIDYTNQDPSDGILTDLTFDDVFNDYNDFIKSWFYKEGIPAIESIRVPPIIVKENYGLSLRVSEGPYISYSIFIVNENDNINIYALKVVNTPE